MSFRLVPNSVTLDDLERRNSPNRCIISPNSVAFAADYVKWLKIHQYFLQWKCRPTNFVFSDNHLWRYWQRISHSESVNVRHYPLARENLTNNQP